MTLAERSVPSEFPRGRHSFSRETVIASQVTRLRDAVAEAVAAKGYNATTVADVVAAAGVSRRTFYEHYADLEACFLDAYRTGMELLLSEIGAALRAHRDADWRERTALSVEAYLRTLAARPAAARAFSIEALGGGAAVVDHRAAVMRRWVDQWSRLATLAAADADPPPRDHLLLLVGGIEELVRECLVTRGADALPDLAPRLTAIALATLTVARAA